MKQQPSITPILSSRTCRSLMAGVLLALSAPAVALTPVSPNLIFNGDAEASAGATSFGGVATPVGWETSGTLSAVRYDVGSSADLNPSDSAAIGGGINYFAGGPSVASVAAIQTVGLSIPVKAPAAGQRWVRLGGYLGGYAQQTDAFDFTAVFIATDGIELGRLKIGAPSVSARESESKLLWRSAATATPVGTQSIRLELRSNIAMGAYSDAYADNLTLQHTVQPGDATADGQVNFDDLLTLARSYNQSGQSWTNGDFSGEGVVNFDDLLTLARNYGSTTTTAPHASLDSAFAADWTLAQSAVPEPMALTAVGMLGFVARRPR